MAHYFEVKRNKAGEYVAYFRYNNEVIFSTEGYSSEKSAKNAIESILKNGPTAEKIFITSDEAENLQRAISSTDWTGLATGMSHAKTVIVRERANQLLKAIIQSDADIQTRTDACKRVEAAIVLLEAPNVPWREVVNLLNHPTITALLAGLSLIQFIIGLGN